MNDTPEEPADLSGLEVREPSAKAQSIDTEQVTKALRKEVADLKAENAELRDRNLRVVAEMENFRRRAERDKTESVKYAASEFGRDMISVADNLRRAIEAVAKDGEQSPAIKTLVEGVEATERELFRAFERHNMTRFDPIGEKFDPHNHEAVVKVDVPNVPADTIVQVLQAGYKIADRILRPATVIVAKGGAAKPTPFDEDHASEDAAHEHDTDFARDASGSPSGAYGMRKDRPGEKRTSTVTQPVTENAGQQQDDRASLGKRLDSGN